MSTRKISTFLCTAVLVLFAGRAIAQNASGTIVGHVKDPAGAAIVAAQVSVTNLDTHDVQNGVDERGGRLHGPCLAAGALSDRRRRPKGSRARSSQASSSTSIKPSV